LQTQDGHNTNGCNQEGAVVQATRVEEGNDQDGDQVINNGQRQQKHPQAGGQGAAQQGQHTHCKGNIGGGRNGPTHQHSRVGIHGGVDQRRQSNGGQGSTDRQHGRAPVGQGTVMD